MAIDHHDFWQQQDHQLANIHQTIMYIALCAPSFLLLNWGWLFDRKPNNKAVTFTMYPIFFSNYVINLMKRDKKWWLFLVCDSFIHHIFIGILEWHGLISNEMLFLVALQALLVWWSLSLPFLIFSSHSLAKDYPTKSIDQLSN